MRGGKQGYYKMPFTLTRERKIILIGGAILLLLGLIYNLAPSVQGMLSEDETLGLKEQKLMKYTAKVNEKASLTQQEKALRNRLKRIEAGLLTPKTPALAAVDIQTMVRDIAASYGAEVKTMRILNAVSEEDQAYVAIPVEVTLSSSVRQLVEVLYGIETSNRLLHVADITARAAGGRKGDTILSTMTVEGFMKKKNA
jgi:hypothetical protein